MKNWGLKVFSLLAALLLFMLVRSQSNSAQVSFIAPVEITNLSSEKVILLSSTRQAQVTVRGPAFLVSQVAASAPAFQIRLPADLENRFEASLSAEALGLPPAVEVVGIEPSHVSLIFDRRVTKVVPVEVPRIGELNSSLQLLQFEVDPKEVTVSGAETEIKEIQKVETFPVDFRELKEDVVQELPLRVPWQHCRVTKHSAVNVSIRLASVSRERKFSDLKVELRSRGAKRWTIAPTSVDLEVSGPEDLVSGLNPAQIVPYVRFDDLADTAKDVPVAVDLPEDLSLVFVDPERVRVQPLLEITPSPTPVKANKKKVKGSGK